MSPDVKRVFLEAVKIKMAEAEEKFGVDMSDVKVELNIRGWRTAGQACWDRRRGYRLRFHPEYIVTHLKEMVETVISHEIAHIVCFKKPALGRDHNRGWQMVDRRLGGTGNRTHSMDEALKKAKAKSNFSNRRSRKKFQYRTTTGMLIEVGPVRHGKILRGAGYRVAGGGTFRKENFIGEA